MEEALRSQLLATAALSALVQSRVNWATRPQGDSLPAVTLEIISDLPQMNLAGPSAWSRSRVQADCWGKTFKTARDVANVIAAPAANGGLHGLRATLSGIRFRIFVIDRGSDDDEVAGVKIHRTWLDLRVWYSL